ncbi:hypothetical protein ACHAXR_009501 [Thalassiosira sp. AJA248-18]
MGVSLPKVILDNRNNADVDSIVENELVDIGAELGSGGTSNKRTLLVFGTSAGDFNTIEYMQRIRASLPELESKGGVDRILFIVNGSPSQCKLITSFLDFPTSSAILSDPTGEAGRKFGVSRGFRPDDTSLSPFAKQFCMGIGIGPPWMSLPAVLPGYFGNPNGRREWIETSLKQGQLAGRWPDNILELDDDQNIVGNKFDNTHF